MCPIPFLDRGTGLGRYVEPRHLTNAWDFRWYTAELSGRGKGYWSLCKAGILGRALKPEPRLDDSTDEDTGVIPSQCATPCTPRSVA